MMRFCPLSRLRSYLLPALAAIILSTGSVGCSSTGDEEPNIELDGAASGEEAGSDNESNSNSGDAVNTNESAEEESGEGGNPVGNELNTALGGNDNGEGLNANVENANEALNENAGINANEGMNALAAEAAGDNGAGFGNDGAVASATDANTSNPFENNVNAESTSPFPESAETIPSEPMNAYGATESLDTGSNGSSGFVAGGASESMEMSSGEGMVSGGPKSLPEQGSKMAYYVMRGDTLGSIAQKVYGARGKWKALQSENGLADANKIYPGDVIYYTLNDSSRAFAQSYEMGARQFHTVSAGDTLSRIAAKYYGTQGAWRILWKENPQILNPDKIRVGTTLTFRVSNKVAVRDENDYEFEEAGDEKGQADAEQDELSQGEASMTEVAMASE